MIAGFAARRRKRLSGDRGVLGATAAGVVEEATGSAIASASRRKATRTTASWTDLKETSGTNNRRSCAIHCRAQVRFRFERKKIQITWKRITENFENL